MALETAFFLQAQNIIQTRSRRSLFFHKQGSGISRRATICLQKVVIGELSKEKFKQAKELGKEKHIS
jgi:rRNA pseudouridine-1189 N-methylase Emg1 (Nep1/Mra1 family)